MLLTLNDDCRSVILNSLFKHHAGVGIFLDFDDDAHAGTVRLVVDVRDAVQALLFDQVGDLS